MERFIITLLFTMILAGEQVYGAEISLKQAIKSAIAQNPKYRSTYHQLTGAEAELKAAKAGYWPELSASLVVDREEPQGNTAGNGATNRVLSAGMSAQIFNGFSTEADVDAKTSQLRKIEADQKTEKLDLIKKVSLAFYQVLYAQQQLELKQAIAKRRKEHKDFLQIRYKGGLEAHWTLSEVEAQLFDAQTEVQQARQFITSSQFQLTELLGNEDSSDLTVTGSFLWKPPKPLPNPQTLIAHHPDLASLTQEIAVAEAALKAQKSQYSPSVSISSDYKSSGDINSHPNNFWSIGLKMTVPLFDAKISPNVEVAAQALSVKHLALADATSSLISAIVTKYTDLTTAIASAQSAKIALAAAKERAIIVNEEYKNGLRQFIDWEQSQSRLTAAEINELSALYSAAKARVEWERIIAKDQTAEN